MLSSINAFFVFMGWYDLKVKTLKIQRRIFADKSKELSKAEYERLLIAAKDKKNERLYYLMQTIASTGLRVSEIKYVTCEACLEEKIMAFFDWNRNGKLDAQDMFLEYNIFKACMEDEDDNDDLFDSDDDFEEYDEFFDEE